ncbi:MAG: hypothetical protein ACLUE1_06410 [Adlercreutzia equolifaciens]
MIGESVAHLKAAGRHVVFDAEHYFDGFKANRDYAPACVEAAVEAGADSVDLCETNGGALPFEVEQIVAATCAAFRARPSASTATTTPVARWPTRSRPCAPAPRACRAR